MGAVEGEEVEARVRAEPKSRTAQEPNQDETRPKQDHLYILRSRFPYLPTGTRSVRSRLRRHDWSMMEGKLSSNLPVNLIQTADMVN
jgi:hypothetical protein